MPLYDDQYWIACRRLELTMITKRRIFRFYLVLIWMTISLCASLPCFADVTADLLDPKLEEQFDWAMFIDVRDIKSYLKYPTSRLHPVTNLKVIYRPLARGQRSEDYVKARVYEEFWYHDHMPIGLKRNQLLQIESNKLALYLYSRRTAKAITYPRSLTHWCA